MRRNSGFLEIAELSRVNLARQVVDWTTLNLGNRLYVLNGYHCNLFFNQSNKACINRLQT